MSHYPDAGTAYQQGANLEGESAARLCPRHGWVAEHDRTARFAGT
jgi:hypothetical protein